MDGHPDLVFLEISRLYGYMKDFYASENSEASQLHLHGICVGYKAYELWEAFRKVSRPGSRSVVEECFFPFPNIVDDHTTIAAMLQ